MELDQPPGSDGDGLSSRMPQLIERGIEGRVLPLYYRAKQWRFHTSAHPLPPEALALRARSSSGLPRGGLGQGRFTQQPAQIDEVLLGGAERSLSSEARHLVVKSAGVNVGFSGRGESLQAARRR